MVKFVIRPADLFVQVFQREKVRKMFETSDFGYVSNQFATYACTCETQADSATDGTGSDECFCEDD